MAVEKLRTGYTTGSCASAAAKAACLLMRDGRVDDEIDIPLPQGGRLSIPIDFGEITSSGAFAGVIKDGGDDPDVTNGLTVIAEVFKVAEQPEAGSAGICFSAGDGVGMVTKDGLQIAVGQPAINPVPRKMITDAVREVLPFPLAIKISIPTGEKVAEHTFNPRLGIVGGLSVLGTTGIVRPYSHHAVVESMKCNMDVALASGLEAPIFTAGNIGTRVAINNLGVDKESVIEVGNEWGELLDYAKDKKIKRALVLGHPGKLAKLIAGDFDTHSSRSGSAVPIMQKIAAEAGIKPKELNTVEGLINSLSHIERKLIGLRTAMDISFAVSQRLGGSFPVSVALLNMKGELTGTYGEVAKWQK